MSTERIRRCYFAGRKLRIDVFDTGRTSTAVGSWPTHNQVRIVASAGGTTLEWEQGVPMHECIDSDSTIASALSFLSAGSCAWDDSPADQERAEAICDAVGGADAVACEREMRFGDL